MQGLGEGAGGGEVGWGGSGGGAAALGSVSGKGYCGVGGRVIGNLQDADGWRLVCAVWDWGSVAGVVGDLGGECGRHGVAFVTVVSSLVVLGMEVSRTKES